MPFWISRLGAGSCGNSGPNLPRHGTETARRKMSCLTQSGVLAETAGRSIKRMVQPLNGDRTGIAGRVWLRDKPCEQGYTPILYFSGEGQRHQGSKGHRHLMGTRGKANGMR